MAFTYEQREERYRSLDPARQELYSGEDIGGKLREVFNRFHLRDGSYSAFALSFGDVVLGLEPEERLPAVLVERLGLVDKLADLIAHDLLELIHAQPAKGQASVVEAPIPEEVPRPAIRPHIPENAPENIPVAPQDEVAPDAPAIPSYKRPLTDIPRYVKDDPYRESTR